MHKNGCRCASKAHSSNKHVERAARLDFHAIIQRRRRLPMADCLRGSTPSVTVIFTRLRPFSGVTVNSPQPEPVDQNDVRELAFGVKFSALSPA